MNSSAQSSLDEDLLHLFVRAVSEQQLEVAEHLLSALEAIAETSDKAKASLHTAYAVVAFQGRGKSEAAAHRQ